MAQKNKKLPKLPKLAPRVATFYPRIIQAGNSLGIYIPEDIIYKLKAKKGDRIKVLLKKEVEF